MRRQRRRWQVHLRHRGRLNRRWQKTKTGRGFRALLRALGHPGRASALTAGSALTVEDLSIDNWSVTYYDDAAMALRYHLTNLSAMSVPGTGPIL